MGRDLRVRRVRLAPESVHNSWDFPSGVTVIAGSSGGGKTQLLSLIQVGFGMDAELVDEVRQNGDGVVLDIEIGDAKLQLHRRFDSNQVVVSDHNGQVRSYATKQSKKLPLLGARLLEELGIPVVRVRQSRTGASNRLTSISFADVFAYCYLDQDQVDRSTVYSDDSFRGPKRASTFELLYGIIDERIADLQVEQLELQDSADKRKDKVSAVTSFLQEKDLADTAEAIDVRLREIAEAEQELQAQLAQAQEDAALAAKVASESPQEIFTLERSLSASERELAEVIEELSGVRIAVRQLERDLQAVRDASDAESVLSTFPFVVCPRCEQRLDTRPSAEGHCIVCLQPDPPLALPIDGQNVAEHLERQLDETRILADRLVATRSAVSVEVNAQRVQLKQQRTALADAIRSATAPYVDKAQRFSAQLGALAGERMLLAQARPLTTAVKQEQEEIAAIPQRVAHLADEEKLHRGYLTPARERVDELSDEFNQILHRLTLPWLESAEIDRTTYLPLVDGRTLKQLSSGGMKTTTNVAYYLASLVTALRDPAILTPSFLMLDSIRKASGADRKDLARADRIYSYLRTLQVSRNNPGALAADFQLIVVDNDLPAEFERAFNVIRIDPDRPLITPK